MFAKSVPRMLRDEKNGGITAAGTRQRSTSLKTNQYQISSEFRHDSAWLSLRRDKYSSSSVPLTRYS